MGPQAAQIAVAVLSMIGVSLGGYAAYRGNTRAKVIESEAAPYQQLASRVDALERQVTLLYADQWADRSYIQRVASAWPADVPMPTPMPAWLAAHYGLAPTFPATPGSIIEPPAH